MVEYAISVAMAMIHIHPKGKCKEGVGYQPAPSVYVTDYLALLLAINLFNRKVKKYGNV